MPTSDKWAPKTTGIRDVRDAKKKNGMFWNWPRYLYFGGAPGASMQGGEKMLNMKPAKGMDAHGPISDRGKGR
jgi:hypothetical protein